MLETCLLIWTIVIVTWSNWSTKSIHAHQASSTHGSSFPTCCYWNDFLVFLPNSGCFKASFPSIWFQTTPNQYSKAYTMLHLNHTALGEWPSTHLVLSNPIIRCLSFITQQFNQRKGILGIANSRLRENPPLFSGFIRNPGSCFSLSPPLFENGVNIIQAVSLIDIYQPCIGLVYVYNFNIYIQFMISISCCFIS